MASRRREREIDRKNLETIGQVQVGAVLEKGGERGLNFLNAKKSCIKISFPAVYFQ